MDEETNKIKQHIDTERQQLGRNLDEIESRVKEATDRVKEATDLKGHFNKHTGWILGGAVAGGFLLSLAFRKSSTESSESRRQDGPSRLVPHLDQLSETFDGILEGLVAVAADKLQSFVSDVVPGFREQFDAVERTQSRFSVHQMKPKSGMDGDASAVNQY